MSAFRSINIGDHGEAGEAVPTGILVRLVCLLGDKEKCEEKLFFWGSRAYEEALSWLFPDMWNLEGLDPGKYRITLHPAWRPKDPMGLNEWDEEVLEDLTFVVKRNVTAEIIEKSVFRGSQR